MAKAQVSAFYRGIPVVDLVPKERKASLQLFGAAGPALLVRLGLVLLVIAGGALTLYFRDQNQRNLDAEETALAGAAVAEDTIVAAEDLQSEIDDLEAIADLGQLDVQFLYGDPASLIAVFRSVFSLDVPGVDVTHIAAIEQSTVEVTLEVSSNSSAFEWRRLIAAQAGVGRVVSFDPVAGQDVLTYTATIVSGDRL